MLRLREGREDSRVVGRFWLGLMAGLLEQGSWREERGGNSRGRLLMEHGYFPLLGLQILVELSGYLRIFADREGLLGFDFEVGSDLGRIQSLMDHCQQRPLVLITG